LLRVALATLMLLIAHAPYSMSEVVSFPSYTPASERPLLTRTYSREPVSISGTLSLPEQRSPFESGGKFPAVILMHGSGGIFSDREVAWARRLNELGIAAFYVDSFTGRGIKAPNYAGTPAFIRTVAHVVDAHRALEVLARHPRIDKTRVAIMGFSRGGEVVMSSMFERFRRGSLDDPSLHFAGHVAFYPYCGFQYRGQEVTRAPLLMLLGGADDMTSPIACQHQADWLRERTSVKVVVYPGANHDFDRDTKIGFDPNMVGIRTCEVTYDVDSFVINRGDGMPTGENDWLARCRFRGAHVGGDPAALKGSIDEVRRFLTRIF
jgi:dienelactone hydrolase